jgi:hypothetical protein
VTRDDLVAQLEAADVSEGDVVYVERRGDDYDWSATSGPEAASAGDNAIVPPDAWIYYTGGWPPPQDDRGRFFDDLLAEMDSMASDEDRCRWPLDEPWGQVH